MNRFIATLTLACFALLSSPSQATTMTFACDQPSELSREEPDLAGQWDVLIDGGGVPNFGVLSVNWADGSLAGSISLPAGVVVVRSLTTVEHRVMMTVVSREGEVRFEGSLAADGKRMCGVVNYHGNRQFGMIAQKRIAPVQQAPTAR